MVKFQIAYNRFNSLPWYYLVCFLIFCLWLVLAARLNLFLSLLGQVPLLDFDAYYATAVAVFINQQHPLTVSVMQSGGPPLTLLPYLPFAFVSLSVARGVYTFCSLLALWLTSFMLSRAIFPKKQLLATTCLAVGLTLTFPVRFTLGMGQWHLIIMYISTLFLLIPKSRVLAVTAMTLFKTNLILTLFSLKSRDQIRAGLLILLTVLVSFPMIKWQYYRDYFQHRLPTAALSQANLENTDYYNQSLKTTLSRLNLDNLYQPLFIFLSILAVVYLVLTHRLDMGLLLSLLLSPILWQHYVVIIYPLLVLAISQHYRNVRHLIPLSIITILLVGQLPWLHEVLLNLISGIAASHYFIGLLGLFFWLLRYPLKGIDQLKT